MTKTKKVFLEVLLSVICAILMLCGFFGLNATANADGIKDFYIYGASVRQSDATYSTAIRFHVLMSDTFYQDHKVGTDEQDVEVGVVLLPERLLNGSELTLDLVETRSAITTETAGVWYESDLVDGYMESVAFVYDIPSTEYGTDLAIVAYYKSGETEPIYTDTVTGSLAYVAKESGMDGLENYYTFTVTYKDGSSTTTETVEYDETAPIKAQATPKKYVANGWKNGLQVWDFANDTVKKNITLEAQYVLADENTEFGFESTAELTYVEKDNKYENLNVEIVNYADESAAYADGTITTTLPANFAFSAYANGGNNVLKLSGSTSTTFGCYYYFNKTVPAGSVISFNVAINVGDSDYTTTNGWVPFYVCEEGNESGTWYTSNMAYWHQSNSATGGFYWLKRTYTLQYDSSFIRFGLNGGNANAHFNTAGTIAMYIDNLIVRDANKSSFDLSGFDAEYLTITTNAGTISYVDYATENAQTNTNGVGKLTNVKIVASPIDPSGFGTILKWSDSGVTKGTGGNKYITIDFGKTLTVGTTISFNLFVYNATVSDNAWFWVFGSGASGGWTQTLRYWANQTPWGQYWTTYTYTLTADSTGIRMAPNLGAGQVSGTVAGTLDFYIDNITITAS